jgi:hypothetical protein
VARTHTFEVAVEVAFRAGFCVGVGVGSGAPNGQQSRESQTEAGSTAVVNTANVSEHSLHENHPLIPIYGRFRDDPTWDRFMESIGEHRRQMNESDDL